MWGVVFPRAGRQVWVGVTPLRCHRCGHVWNYCGQSECRTTCKICGATVYLSRCIITVEEYDALKIEELSEQIQKHKMGSGVGNGSGFS